MDVIVSNSSITDYSRDVNYNRDTSNSGIGINSMGTPKTTAVAPKTTAVTPEMMGTAISRRGVISSFGGSNIRDNNHSRIINSSKNIANSRVDSNKRDKWNTRGCQQLRDGSVTRSSQNSTISQKSTWNIPIYLVIWYLYK